MRDAFGNLNAPLDLIVVFVPLEHVRHFRQTDDRFFKAARGFISSQA